ncbi:MAG: DUF1304 domain-containing protein [Lactobacillus sp.]|jgi:putative membrane protein|nr:DUF1304 domain-containing protein [Lactobacillus sp.]MCI2033302.1 DUF1304 domain-containing protein [Lactobacillus sp.]
MTMIFTGLVILLGVLHLVIMGLEMFANTDTQAQAFGMTKAFVVQPEAQVALKNMGIYNGMLGVALLAALALPDAATALLAQMGLAAFVLVVGLYGGVTVTKKIYLIQALPAAVTLVFGWLAMRG